MPIIVVTAGGWDPIHGAHIAHLLAARSLGDMLIVITHTDEIMVRKKGYAFLPLEDRLAILRQLRCVDQVVVAEELGDQDGTVTRSLQTIGPDIFAKGGDRTGPENMPPGELEVCDKLGIKIVYGVGGGKVQSSSELVRAAWERVKA